MTQDDLDQLMKDNQANDVAAAYPGSVNATNRIFARSPGILAPGSTDDTDRANADVANAMDRADLANRSAFVIPPASTSVTSPPAAPAEIDINAVNARRNAIISSKKTGTDPDAASRFIDAKRSAQLDHELATLTSVAREHTLNANDKLHASLQAQRDLEVSTQVKNALTGLAQIPMDGSPESAAAMLKLKQDNILGWLHSPGLRDEFKTHAKTHDAVAEAANAGAQEYYTPDALLKENPGAEYRQNPKTGGFIVSIGNPKGQRTGPGTADDGFASLDDHLQKNYGITTDDLDKVNLNDPKTVQLFNERGKPISSAAAAEAGDKAHATIYGVGAKGYTEIPYKEFQKLSQTYQNLASSVPADAGTAAAVATVPPPDITPEAHAALKSGDKFWWHGQQLTKK